jgi:hypothetical protein
MFVPANFQVAFVNVISIFWSMYMSHMKNSKIHHEQEAAAAALCFVNKPSESNKDN